MPRPRRKGEKYGTRFSVEQVGEALKACGGIKTHAARLLAKTYKRPCSRPLINKYVNENVELQELLVRIEETCLDHAEAKLHENIEQGIPASIHYYLSRKGGKRGYVAEHRLSGPDGGPIPFELDLSKYTTEELRTLRALLTRGEDAAAADR